MLSIVVQAPEMLFRPSLDAGVPDGFYDLIDGLVGDVYKQASKIQRLAAHSGQEHYQVRWWAGGLKHSGIKVKQSRFVPSCHHSEL